MTICANFPDVINRYENRDNKTNIFLVVDSKTISNLWDCIKNHDSEGYAFHNMNNGIYIVYEVLTQKTALLLVQDYFASYYFKKEKSDKKEEGLY